MLRGREIEEHRRINRNGATGAAVVSTPLSTGFEDLSIVVNGYDDDPIDMKPFDKFFNKERIVLSWKRVDIVPFTRNCLKHKKKVRHEIGKQGEAKSAELEDLQASMFIWYHWQGVVDSMQVSLMQAYLLQSE
jgi:hypothetical protein